ncbi:MAG: hypothetical protein EOM20_13195 [Spartobacteria bacterium]|nr:hypothetical protein [Spartobacteria bacterium]
MKNNIDFIFVDDGYPEASDYDNNFVFYDSSKSGSYERAVKQAEGMKPSQHVMPPIPTAAQPSDLHRKPPLLHPH